MLKQFLLLFLAFDSSVPLLHQRKILIKLIAATVVHCSDNEGISECADDHQATRCYNRKRKRTLDKSVVGVVGVEVTVVVAVVVEVVVVVEVK